MSREDRFDRESRPNPKAEYWQERAAFWRGEALRLGYAPEGERDTRPSWEDAPDWAEWLAQDADGGWWFYSDCPESDAWRDEWQKTCGSTQHVSSGPSNRRWRTTLERRPESTKAGKLHVEIDASEARRVVDEALKDAFEEIPDMIIPKDAAAQIEAYSFISDLARMGYRIEVDSEGIRGWKE